MKKWRHMIQWHPATPIMGSKVMIKQVEKTIEAETREEAEKRLIGYLEAKGEIIENSSKKVIAMDNIDHWVEKIK